MKNNNLEELFSKSNSILFSKNVVITKELKEIITARLNLAKTVSVSDKNNSEFDNLIKSLEYSLESSDDLMSLSLISKINHTLVNITDSFDSISKIVNVNLNNK